MNAKRRDMIAGLIIFFIGLLTIGVLIPMGVVEPRKVKFAALSPSYYPRLVAIVMMLLGAAVAWLAWRRTSSGSTTQTTTPSTRHPNAAMRFGIVILLLAAFAALLEAVGFVPISALALLWLMIMGGERRWFVLLAVALVAPFLLHYFFLWVAHIPIPAGILSNRLPGF